MWGLKSLLRQAGEQPWCWLARVGGRLVNVSQKGVRVAAALPTAVGRDRGLDGTSASGRKGYEGA